MCGFAWSGFAALLLVITVTICWGQEGEKPRGANSETSAFNLDEYLDSPYLISSNDFRDIFGKESVGKMGLSGQDFAKIGEGSISFIIKQLGEETGFRVILSDYRLWNAKLRSTRMIKVQRPEKIPLFLKVRKADASYSVIDIHRSLVQYFSLNNRYSICVLPESEQMTEDKEVLEKVDRMVQTIVSLIEAKIQDAKRLDGKE